MINMIFEMLIWYVVVQILAFLSLPLCLYIFRNLHDRGYTASKTVGILLSSYFAWLLSFVFVYNISIIISLLILAALFLLLYKKVEMKKYLKKNIKLVKTAETVFLLSFIFFTVVRAHTPAAEGLEKLFDMSMINGILKSEKMPPIDPWYSGEKINYYYFGHFMIATLTKISFLPSYITFNLALGMLFALISIGSFSVCYNLTKKVNLGLIGIFFLVILGNLLGFLQIITIIIPQLNNFFSNAFDIKYAMSCCHVPGGKLIEQLISFPVWSSTRIIPNTINEFPYASFLFGEVHSHILSIPLQLVMINLLLNLLLSDINYLKLNDIKSKIQLLFPIPLLLGLLYFTNSWELPTYTILFCFVLFYKIIKSNIRKLNFLYVRNQFLILVSIIIFTIFLIFPYLVTVKKATNYGLVNERSNIFQIFIIFSVFLFITASFNFKYEKLTKIFIYFIISLLLYLILKIQLILITIPLIIISIKTFLKVKNEYTSFVLILSTIALLILLFCEIVFIDSRYNTVFKFYYHVWIFSSISSVYFLNSLWNNKSKIWKFFLILLIVCCLVVPVFSTLDRIKIGLNEGVTLDGLEYMKKYHPNDYEIVIWARKNIKDNPIILEAPGGAFTYSSIFSTYTGLQTIVGWDNHVAIHHGQWPTERVNDGNKIYNTINITEAKELLEKYGIKYIFVGSVEIMKYPEASLKKFNQFEILKTFGENAIYKVG